MDCAGVSYKASRSSTAQQIRLMGESERETEAKISHTRLQVGFSSNLPTIMFQRHSRAGICGMDICDAEQDPEFLGAEIAVHGR